LDEDSLKEKRRQKLMKAGYEARLRAKQEKEREIELRVAQEKQEEDERTADLEGWARKLRQEQEVSDRFSRYLVLLLICSTLLGINDTYQRACKEKGSSQR
jgi:hypothetical protein